MKRQDSVNAYRDISAAIKATNLNRDGSAARIVQWSRVKEEMLKHNKVYADWNTEKIRNHYKYLNKLKKQKLKYQ